MAWRAAMSRGGENSAPGRHLREVHEGKELETKRSSLVWAKVRMNTMRLNMNQKIECTSGSSLRKAAVPNCPV